MLPGPDHFAGLGAARGDDACGGGAQLRVAQAVLGEVDVRAGRVHLRLGRLQHRDRLVERRTRNGVLGHQVAHARCDCCAPPRAAPGLRRAARAPPAGRFPRSADRACASNWPGRTVSPISTVRSISRPPIRNDSLISVCACTVPVRAMVSPMARVSMVVTRTGRTSAAGASSPDRQADSSASVARARRVVVPGRQAFRLAADFNDTGRLPFDVAPDSSGLI